MKKRSIKNIFLISLISIFLFVFNALIKKNYILYAESIVAAFMIIVIFLSIQMFGFQKDKKTLLKRDLFLKTMQVLITYFIIIYLLGIHFGYSKIAFSLKPRAIINNTFAPIIIFICLEIFRYIIINNNKDNKKTIVVYSFVIGLIELSITTRYLNFYSLEVAYTTIADYILPIIVKQIALGYLCYHGGLKPMFLYRMVMVLYTYVMPIQPNFSKSILCVCNILLPVIILIKTNEVIEEESNEKKLAVSKSNIFGNAAGMVAVGILVVLVSGIAPIGITAIGSDSMRPTFSKGAGVITLKVKEDSIKKGDIISFNKDNKKTIHRVEKIEVDGDVIKYYTKGDFNNTQDDGYITYEDINSKIIFTIPLIGYPSVIISELFSK